MRKVIVGNRRIKEHIKKPEIMKNLNFEFKAFCIFLNLTHQHQKSQLDIYLAKHDTEQPLKLQRHVILVHPIEVLSLVKLK